MKIIEKKSQSVESNLMDILLCIPDGYHHTKLQQQQIDNDVTNAIGCEQDITNVPDSKWQPRIQSMVVQNDGSIILCDNDSELARRPRIEVVEILSPTKYVRGKENR